MHLEDSKATMTFLLAVAAALAFGFIIGGMGWILSYIDWRCEVRRHIKKRDCTACKKCGTYKCPSLHLCYEREDKPYFEPDEEHERFEHYGK